MKGMELYGRVRYAVQVEGLSRREAPRRFGTHPRAVAKMMKFAASPGYVGTEPTARPKLDPFIAAIDRILFDDKSRPRKQQHTAKRIFERLRDEYGFTGGHTIMRIASPAGVNSVASEQPHCAAAHENSDGEPAGAGRRHPALQGKKTATSPPPAPRRPGIGIRRPSGEIRRHLHRRAHGGHAPASGALPVKTGDLSGAAPAGAFSIASEQPAAPQRTRTPS
jgi:hypothetical protein